MPSVDNKTCYCNGLCSKSMLHFVPLTQQEHLERFLDLHLQMEQDYQHHFPFKRSHSLSQSELVVYLEGRIIFHKQEVNFHASTMDIGL